MELITEKDRAVLRKLAERKAAYAQDEKNKAILKKWHAQAERLRETPTVRLLFGNLQEEIITPQMQCTGATARKIEAALRSSMVGRELFDDDTPTSATFDLRWNRWVEPFGITGKRTQHSASKGYHIDPVIEDLESDFEKLKGGSFGVSKEETLALYDAAADIFGDILPPKIIGFQLHGAITNPLVHLMGMENYYMSMYDCPDTLHQVMDMATTVYERFFDFLEQENLLLPMDDFTPVGQETYAFNCELPKENVTKTTQCWGFLESQETTSVSPKTFGEFVFPYQDRLVKRFGLLSYGCCERVDAIWPDYLSKWENLRKLSVSPFNNEDLVGEYLRGSNVVYYSKPRAELVSTPGAMDEEAVHKDFMRICQAASGCLFEIGQREVLTLHGDLQRGRRYVEIAKECIDRYWKP